MRVKFKCIPKKSWKRKKFKRRRRTDKILATNKHKIETNAITQRKDPKSAEKNRTLQDEQMKEDWGDEFNILNMIDTITEGRKEEELLYVNVNENIP